jgi:hypothetical protein
LANVFRFGRIFYYLIFYGFLRKASERQAGIQKTENKGKIVLAFELFLLET